MAVECIAPLYMQRFQCLGDQCEDNCCQVGWHIAVDQEHYKKLKKVMSHSKADRERFRQTLKRTRGDKASRLSYASLQLQDNGSCPFLEHEGLCALHANHGPEFLPYICASYPRLFNTSGARLEMAGTISCPEVARQCLLAEDAMALVDYDISGLPYKRVWNTLSLAPDCEDFYQGYLDDIRSVVIGLLLQKHYPIRSRLFFLAYFASRTEAFYHDAIQEDPVAGLKREINHLENPTVQDELHRQFGDLELDNTLGMSIIQAIAVSRTQVDFNGRYNELLINTLSHYEQAIGLVSSSDNITFNLSAKDLWASYCQRREQLEKNFGARIDSILTNYCCNYWFKEWYTKSQNLMVHTRDLLIRVSILRFFFYSHPEIKKMLESCAGGEINDGSACHKTIDDIAVEVFYIFSRSMEHTVSFLNRINSVLEDNEMTSLSHMIFLIAF